MTGEGGSTAPAATGVFAAVLASTCCILPLLLIFSGAAGAGLMTTMMRWEWLTLPLGVLGLIVGWTMYFREHRHCQAQACRYVGRRANLLLLGVATIVVVTALLLRLFPNWTASLLQMLIPTPTPAG